MTYKLCNINDYSDAQYDAMYRAAAPDKQARADRFKHADDRKRCLCADMLARSMLSAACGLAANEIAFTYSEKGKPSANVPMHFNVSHSGEWVVCALSDTPVGADIEMIKPFRAGMVARYFTEAEADYVWGDAPTHEGNVTDPDTCARFYRVWTAKEAFVKMTGTGISTDLSKVCFDPQAQNVNGAKLYSPTCPDGYVIAIIKS